jgi:hypothetical protein
VLQPDRNDGCCGAHPDHHDIEECAMPTTRDEARPKPESYDTDTAIVRAGPIGLTLACALAHQGVRFRLFETRTQPPKYSTANNLWARPQELVAGVGVREALAEKSYQVTDVNVIINGQTLQQEDSRAGSPYSAALYTGQDVIQTTLAEVLDVRGTRSSVVAPSCRSARTTSSQTPAAAADSPSTVARLFDLDQHAHTAYGLQDARAGPHPARRPHRLPRNRGGHRRPAAPSPAPHRQRRHTCSDAPCA